MLQTILKDREFNSNNDITKAIVSARNDSTFTDLQNAFRNWTSHLARVMKNREECPLE
jgi:hypothetical protein